MNFDLTQYKIDKVNIDMSTGSLEVRLGNLNERTILDISSGSADIDILVPVSSGCQIKMNGSFNSKNFPSFNKIKENLYQTINFEESEKKIYIDLDCREPAISVKLYEYLY
jgi:hypothetical protein